MKGFAMLAALLLAVPMQAQRLAGYASQLDEILVQPQQFAPLPRANDSFWRDSLPPAMRRSYVSEGERVLGQPWPALSFTVFAQFKETGNRVNYEALCFEKRRHLAVLVMAEVVEGKGRFMPDIIDGMGSFCEETWWGIPAHYGTKVPRTEDQAVDLFNAETAGLIAWATYMLRPQLDAFAPQLSKRIDGEIKRRILEPARKQNHWWKRAGMNWNPWICSNWLACTLLAEDRREQQVEAVTQILQATDAFIDSYKDDGGCDEGPGYWDRAAASMYEILNLLRQATGGRIDLSHDAKVRAMGSYVYKTYIGNGYCTTFADVHSNHAVGEPNILYPFACFLDDDLMKGYAAYTARQRDYIDKAGAFFSASHNFPSLARELPFLRKIRGFIEEKPREPLLSDVWLGDLQVFTARRGNLFVAMKGGNNGESHNHNDVGEFIVYATPNPKERTALEPLLIDPGVGEYTSKTFSGQRYSIWTMQSQYHNLPQINGIDQHDGKDFYAEVVSQKSGKLTLDIAKAYPETAAVSSWKRTVAIDKRAISVTEDYELKEVKAPTRLMLLATQQPLLQKEGRIAVGAYALTYTPSQLEASVEDISSQLDPLLQGMWGKHLYRIVLTLKSQNSKGKLIYKIGIN